MTTTHAVIALSEDTPIRLSNQTLHSGSDLTIQNLHASAYVYVGGEDVSTTSYGFRINPDTAFSVELPGTNELWAVTSDEGSQVAVLTLNLEE